MIIELYGLTRSGKTYLAKKLNKKGFELASYNSKFLKYANSFIFFVRNPIISSDLIHRLNKFSNSSVSLMNLRKRIKLRIIRNILLLATMASYNKAQSSNEDIILDEGFFQIIHTIYEEKSSKERINEIMNIIPKPDLLVIINSPKKIRMKRLMDKGYPRKDEFGEKYFKEWHLTMKHNDLLINKILVEKEFDFIVEKVNFNRSFDILKILKSGK